VAQVIALQSFGKARGVLLLGTLLVGIVVAYSAYLFVTKIL